MARLVFMMKIGRTMNVSKKQQLLFNEGEVRESIITDVYNSDYITIQVVDETPEITITNNVYSLSEAIDLHQELVQAVDVLMEYRETTYSERMQEQLEPIFDEEKANKRMDIIGQNGNEGLHYGEIEELDK